MMGSFQRQNNLRPGTRQTSKHCWSTWLISAQDTLLRQVKHYYFTRLAAGSGNKVISNDLPVVVETIRNWTANDSSDFPPPILGCYWIIAIQWYSFGPNRVVPEKHSKCTYFVQDETKTLGAQYHRTKLDFKKLVLFLSTNLSWDWSGCPCFRLPIQIPLLELLP